MHWRQEQERSFAAHTLADYLSEDAEGLFDLAADADRNYWLGAKEAKEYGLIDNVLVSQETSKSDEKD